MVSRPRHREMVCDKLMALPRFSAAVRQVAFPRSKSRRPLALNVVLKLGPFRLTHAELVALVGGRPAGPRPSLRGFGAQRVQAREGRRRASGIITTGRVVRAPAARRGLPRVSGRIRNVLEPSRSHP